MKQRQSQLGFERLDLLRERGLRDIETLGCAREIQLLGDGQEVPEVT